MRNAETVLDIIHGRGKRGLPLEDVYRQLYNPDLYLRAYGKIYTNDGAMTRGSTNETVDGMSQEKILHIIDLVRQERVKWTPVRRTYIPKANGKERPLGMPTWTDKLLQEVMRSILEAYYESQLSIHSHGFRPGLGCHTALRDILKWGGTVWCIEGDITGYFDNIDPQVMLSILGEKIHDNRFIRLRGNLLKAGYLEDWKYHPTLSGTPQGGIISPLLSNIYLDRLDQFVGTDLLPRYNTSQKRKKNREYMALHHRMFRAKKKGNVTTYDELRKQSLRISSEDRTDPDFRRLRYARYADDTLLGCVGPKAEAMEIKETLRIFLAETLKLEFSKEKTLITHAQTERAKFLGYEIFRFQDDTKHDRSGRRSINGKMSLQVPQEAIRERCQLYMKHGKPVHRAELINDDEYSIVNRYQGE